MHVFYVLATTSRIQINVFYVCFCAPWQRRDDGLGSNARILRARDDRSDSNARILRVFATQINPPPPLEHGPVGGPKARRTKRTLGLSLDRENGAQEVPK